MMKINGAYGRRERALAAGFSRGRNLRAMAVVVEEIRPIGIAADNRYLGCLIRTIVINRIIYNAMRAFHIG